MAQNKTRLSELLNEATQERSVGMRFESFVRQEDENSRRFTVSFSSETPYERWFGIEILSHADGAVDLSRLNEIGVLLFNHDTFSVIGKVVRAWIEKEKGYAEVEFDTDEEAERIYQKVKSGTLKTTSVRYTVDNWEDVSAGKTSEDGRFKGPCSVAKRWMPLEISIVSVPADATVGVGRSHEPAKKNKEATGRSIHELQSLLNKEKEY